MSDEGVEVELASYDAHRAPCLPPLSLPRPPTSHAGSLPTLNHLPFTPSSFACLPTMGDRIATGGGFANTAGDKAGTMTTEWGAPVGDKDHSLVATPSGGLLLQDTVTLNKLSRFNRERIPERVVHARGTGAYGYFEAYEDESALTRAAFLSKPGERVPLFCRFSLVTLSKSVAETTRDVRGFAVKMKTSEGIWDMVRWWATRTWRGGGWGEGVVFRWSPLWPLAGCPALAVLSL